MSNLNFNDFLNIFSSELLINRVLTGEELLSSIEEFDSMGKITISLTIENLFDYQISYDDLDKVQSIQELYNFCLEKISK